MAGELLLDLVQLAKVDESSLVTRISVIEDVESGTDFVELNVAGQVLDNITDAARTFAIELRDARTNEPYGNWCDCAARAMQHRLANS